MSVITAYTFLSDDYTPVPNWIYENRNKITRKSVNIWFATPLLVNKTYKLRVENPDIALWFTTNPEIANVKSPFIAKCIIFNKFEEQLDHQIVSNHFKVLEITKNDT